MAGLCFTVVTHLNQLQSFFRCSLCSLVSGLWLLSDTWAQKTMANPVEVTKSHELHTNTGQTEGMIRKGAITDRAEGISASVMIAKPHSSSAIHHHGEQNTIVYCVRGRGAVVSDGGNKIQVLEKGDFALIPAHAEHQEVNEGDEEVEWIITRSGRVPVVENLEGGWGTS